MTFDANKTFQETEKLLSGDLASSLVFITRDKENQNGYAFKKVLLNDNLQESFRKSFLGKISSINKNIQKKRFEKYSPTNTTDSIKYISGDEVDKKLLSIDKIKWKRLMVAS